MKNFITGSQAYGKPNEKSDVDLVILIDYPTLNLLYETSGGELKDYDCLSIKFGKLNLLCCTDEKQYNTWLEGTEYLKSIKPVERDFAVNHFRNLRAKNYAGK